MYAIPSILFCLYFIHVVSILPLNLVSSFINPGSPTIISVSKSLNSFVSPSGSLEGGTMIYIRGTNFSPNPG